ncbi:hypothetical protein [Streptomyces sp. 5-6(2022)]
MIDKLESLKWDAEEVLQGRAKKADWAGENATVTREFVTKTAKEFGDAYNQAVTIRNILQDTRNELISYRDELKRTISTAQKEKNLTVVPSGNGWTIQMNIHPDRAGKGIDLPEHSQADMEDLSGDIKRIVKNLRYLTKERVWRSDAPMGDPDKIVGYDKLGHALESATTGYAYDAPELNGKHPMVPGSADRRTAETADVMEQVAYIYGGKDGPKLIHEQEGISDSLGRMGAAYIDDINNSVSGISDNAGHDPSEFPAKYQGRAEFGNQGAIDFLSVLGQDEKSHGIVTAAEHVYSLSVLDDSPANSDAHYQRGKDALLTDAEVRGILDHSRVQQAETTYGANSEEANKSIAKSGEWGKYLIGTGVAAGVAMVPVPGSTGAAIALAPVATEAAGEMLNTFLGQKVDEAVDGANSDPQNRPRTREGSFSRQAPTT